MTSSGCRSPPRPWRRPAGEEGEGDGGRPGAEGGGGGAGEGGRCRPTGNRLPSEGFEVKKRHFVGNQDEFFPAIAIFSIFVSFMKNRSACIFNGYFAFRTAKTKKI